MRTLILALAATGAMAATPASAVTNLIVNGSFEAGAPGTGGFAGWTLTNTPTGSARGDAAASIITYDNTLPYPLGAFGERVTPDTSISASPDAVGDKAAYFVGDLSVNESISQLTYLGVGNYRIGFSYYLTQNGLNNIGNSSFDATIIGIPVASTMITGSSPARTWLTASGVGQIALAGHYNTAFVFNSNLFPSKDIVIDRVFAVVTTDPATVLIPPTPTTVPEPQSWALLIAGFGLVGATMRRRRGRVAA